MLNIDTIQSRCDFCDSANVSCVYEVKTSRRGANVMMCNDCGLFQTLYKYTDNTKQQSLSADANWGNIRHGKKIRLQKSIDVLDNIIKSKQINRILDIGSNRGHFINYVLNNNTDVIVDAIEPDKTILQEYQNNDNLNVYNIRFERFITQEKYDLIYCCHTLEHADSASAMLKKARSLLSENNGKLYIDVPNINILDDPHNIQEFFIDKHSFHFDCDILTNYLKMLGFNIENYSDDNRNIVLLCTQKYHDITKVKNYNQHLVNNREKLVQTTKIIHKFANNGSTMIYGASQILDALINYGNLDISNINCIVDDYLYGYVDKIDNHKIHNITHIKDQKFDNIILLTKSASASIKNKLQDNNVKFNNIFSFDELMTKTT